MSLEEITKPDTGTLRLVSAERKTEHAQAVPRQFVNFAFYRALPHFRQLAPNVKESARKEFVDVCDEFRSQIILHNYSLVGLRRNADFMLWRIGYDLDAFQEMTARLNQTTLGQYLEITESFLSMTKRSLYIDKLNPQHDEDRLHILPGKGKYLFVYPFVKTRAWYMRTPDERQLLMDEHIRIGTKYHMVKLHTTYSFGLDDQEFVVAFEADDPTDFLDLVEELRFTKASEFTLRDTPMYTCRQHDLDKCLQAIG